MGRRQTKDLRVTTRDHHPKSLLASSEDHNSTLAAHPKTPQEAQGTTEDRHNIPEVLRNIRAAPGASAALGVSGHLGNREVHHRIMEEDREDRLITGVLGSMEDRDQMGANTAEDRKEDRKVSDVGRKDVENCTVYHMRSVPFSWVLYQRGYL